MKIYERAASLANPKKLIEMFGTVHFTNTSDQNNLQATTATEGDAEHARCKAQTPDATLVRCERHEEVGFH